MGPDSGTRQWDPTVGPDSGGFNLNILGEGSNVPDESSRGLMFWTLKKTVIMVLDNATSFLAWEGKGAGSGAKGGAGGGGGG